MVVEATPWGIANEFYHDAMPGITGNVQACMIKTSQLLCLTRGIISRIGVSCLSSLWAKELAGRYGVCMRVLMQSFLSTLQ